MGLSNVISGIIILTVFMMLLYSIPAYIDPIFSIGESSTQSSKEINLVLKTEISLDSLVALPGSPKINFTLNNEGDEKLWQFENFDLFINYDSSTGKKIETLSYTGSCKGGVPAANSWCVEEIVWDLTDSGILNKGESAMIRSQVTQNPVTGIVGVIVSTPNGIVTSTSAAI
jgi:hypothetical protein